MVQLATGNPTLTTAMLSLIVPIAASQSMRKASLACVEKGVHGMHSSASTPHSARSVSPERGLEALS